MAAFTAVAKLNPRVACPLVTQVRYRRIRGRNPREPHFEKKAILEACKPIIPRCSKPLWESCSMANRIDMEREPHPYNRIRANILRNELHEAKLICFMHENSVLMEDRRKIHNMLFKKNFFLKAYNNETVRLAITGTKFESALPFTRSRNALILSPESDVQTFFKLTRKIPQFVLLACRSECRPLFWACRHCSRTLPKQRRDAVAEHSAKHRVPPGADMCDSLLDGIEDTSDHVSPPE
ncbi:hypothetical protein V5799_027849 [Amblyomma americanum]|uniref:Large ribosomal subunit protein uL10m n=1 Tax=Amblyomma americanum TaxID=6943 RepID=A0AAQ4DEJ2_AMBAM